MIIRKTPAEIEKMRAAGDVVARCLKGITERIVPGRTTTLDIDKMAEQMIMEFGAVPSFKNYRGYPNTACVAVNEEVVHGIPSARVLVPGDIVGMAMRLLKIGREGLYKGIEQAVTGNRLSDIGHAIQRHVEGHGYSVVRDLVGHGIGREMHEDPHVPNYGEPGKGPRLEEGMTLAIEPMINAGEFQVETLGDGWTVVTKDRSLSVHFEHTVAITKNGPDILTLLPAQEAVSVNG